MRWLIAASPREADEVRARYVAMERGHRKVARIDEFMERKAAEKRAREAAN